MISKSPYLQLVDDKELIVDKVVLINKDPYHPLFQAVYRSMPSSSETRMCEQA